MKKIAILFLALCLAGGAASAFDGLSVGAEMGIMDFDEVMNTIVMRPYVSFEKSFGAFDIFLESGVPFWVDDAADSGDFWLGIDIYADLVYNLELGSGKLAFGLENWLYLPVAEDFMVSTRSPFVYNPMAAFLSALGTASINGLFGVSYKFSMYMNPHVTYTHGLSFGDIYGRVDMPFVVMADSDLDVKAFDVAMMNLTAGVNAKGGYGGGMTIYNWINDPYEEKVKFLNTIGLFGHYEMDAFYFGVEMIVPIDSDYMDFMGIAVIPEVRYTLNDSFSFYSKLPISRINAEKDAEGDTIQIGLIVGAKYSF